VVRLVRRTVAEVFQLLFLETLQKEVRIYNANTVVIFTLMIVEPLESIVQMHILASIIIILKIGLGSDRQIFSAFK